MKLWVTAAIVRSCCGSCSCTARGRRALDHRPLLARCPRRCGQQAWLGYTVLVTARRRRDARLFLVSLAFLASAAFLRLHALATPGAARNAGFELRRRRSGSWVAAAFAAASSLELRPEQARSARRPDRCCAPSRSSSGSRAGGAPLATLPRFDIRRRRARRFAVGLHRPSRVPPSTPWHNRSRLALCPTARRPVPRSRLLLRSHCCAEAMVVMPWARNWQPWWDVARADALGVRRDRSIARREWRERFSYLEPDARRRPRCRRPPRPT